MNETPSGEIAKAWSSDELSTESLRSALQIRLLMALDLIKRSSSAEAKLKWKNPSIVRDSYFLARKKKSQAGTNLAIQPSLLALILSQDISSDQLKSLRQISKRDSANFANARAGFNPISYITWTQLDDLDATGLASVGSRLDRSLIEQRIALYGSNVVGAVDTLINIQRFVDEFLVRVSANGESKGLLECLALECGLGESLRTITGLSAAIIKLKRLFWYTFGVDIFNGAQLLLSSSEEIDEQTYIRLSETFKVFRAKPIFDKLVMLRACAGDRIAIQLAEQQKEGKEPLSVGPEMASTARDRLREAKSSSDQDFEFHELPFLAGTLKSLQELTRAMDVENAELAIDLLAEIERTEPEALNFVNWSRLHKILSPLRPIDSTRELYAATLFLDYCKFHKHQAAATAKGQGYLIAKLSKAINDTRFTSVGTKVADLARRLARLDRRNASSIARHILKRDVLRLVPYFGKVRLNASSGTETRVDRQVSDVRFQLAENLFMMGIIEKEALAQCTMEELEYLKLLKFYEQDRKGRVRVSWASIERYVWNHLTGREPNLYVEIASRRIHDVSRDLLMASADDLADDISMQVLFLSDSSLDWCLSNHIRHGHIETTFLGGFYSAVDAYANNRAPEEDAKFRIGDKFSDAEEINKLFGSAASKVNAFASDLNRSIEEYKSRWISLELNDPIHRDLRRRICETLVDYASTEVKSPHWVSEVCDAVLVHAKAEIENFLDFSRGGVKGEFAESLESLTSNLKAELSGTELKNLPLFFENLQKGMAWSLTAVEAWLHQNQSNLVANDFRAEEVTKYLLSTVFSAYGKTDPIQCASFVVEPSGRKRRSPEIDGTHFDFFFQVIFNGLQNALIHSGHGRNTECSIEIVFEESVLTVRIASVLSEQRTSEVIGNYTKIAESARLIEPSEFAHEGGSGIAKIKRVARSNLGCETHVTIPPVSKFRRRFLIEYVFPVSAHGLLSRKAKWSAS